MLSLPLSATGSGEGEIAGLAGRESAEEQAGRGKREELIGWLAV